MTNQITTATNQTVAGEIAQADFTKNNDSHLNSRREKLQEINEKFHGNDREAQKYRAYEGLLECGSLTTQEMRMELDIMHPAGRVKELRAMDYDIRTVWTNYPTTCGKLHRMARYVYAGKVAT